MSSPLPLDLASPQREALPPILDLTPPPHPEAAADGRRQEKDSDVDSDVVSNIEEEKMYDIEREEEKLIPKDWAGQVEEESRPRDDLVVNTKQKEAFLSIEEEFKKGGGQDWEAYLEKRR